MVRSKHSWALVTRCQAREYRGVVLDYAPGPKSPSGISFYQSCHCVRFCADDGVSGGHSISCARRPRGLATILRRRCIDRCPSTPVLSPTRKLFRRPRNATSRCRHVCSCGRRSSPSRHETAPRTSQYFQTMSHQIRERLRTSPSQTHVQKRSNSSDQHSVQDEA